MDELRLPYHNFASLLQGSKRKAWDIYLLFPVGRVRHRRVRDTHDGAVRAVIEWMSKLRGYNDFPLRTCESVCSGSCFARVCKPMPRLTKVRRVPHCARVDGHIGDKSVDRVRKHQHAQHVCSRSGPAHHSCRATGHRELRHYFLLVGRVLPPPEGCVGYQTRFWNGTDVWSATARRHYLQYRRC